MFREFSVYMDDNTLLKVNKNDLEFITLLRLKQFKDNIIISEKEKKYREKEIGDFIYFLRGFNNNKKVMSGNNYKIYSYYKKHTILQDYVLNKDSYNKSYMNVFNKLKEEKKTLKEIRDNQLKTKILNEPYYTKEDFILIRTIFSKDEISFLKGKKNKKSISATFKDFNRKIQKEYKNNLEMLLQTHKTNYKQLNLIAKEQPTTKEEFIKNLHKLGLKDNYVDINYLNMFDLLEEKIQYCKETNIIVKKTELDLTPDVIEENSNCVILKRFNKEDKLFLLNNSETTLKKYDKLNKKLKIYSYNKITKEKNKLIEIPSYKYKIQRKEKHITKCIMDNVPEVLSENISKLLGMELKSLNIDEFYICTDIIKLNMDKLKKTLDTQLFVFQTLNSFPNFNNKLYDKDLIGKKILAAKSMNFHMEEGKQFNNIRFSFGYSTPYDNKEVLPIIKTRMEKLGINFLEVIPKISDLCNILTPLMYVNIDEKMLMIENYEVNYFINLEYGNKSFNNYSDYNKTDIQSFLNSMLYAKRDETIEGINMFIGVDVYNGITAAPSGSGKSFNTVNKLLNFYYLNNENRITIIDRGGSYVKITDMLGGTNIKIKASSKENCVNPFNFSHYMLRLKTIILLSDKYNNKLKLERNEKKLNKIEKEYLKENSITEEEYKIMIELSKLPLLNTSLGKDTIEIDDNGGIISHSFKLTEPQEFFSLLRTYLENMLNIKNVSQNIKNLLNISEILDKVVLDLFMNEVYKNYKNIDIVNMGKEEINKFLYKEQMNFSYILIEDIKKEFINYIEKKNFKIKEELLGQVSILNKYINTGEYGYLFNGKPKLNMENRFINIDFGEIEDDLILSLVAGALIMGFNSNMTNPKYKSAKKLLIIDEAHKIFDSSDVSGLASIAYLYRTVRKHNAAVNCLSQTISDFYKPSVHPKASYFSALTGNSAWIEILKHPKELKEVDLLGCSEELKEYIRKNESFKFVYLSQFTSGILELIFSDLDYSISTTNKEEQNIQFLFSKMFFEDKMKKSILLFSELFGMNFLKKYISEIEFYKIIGSSKNLEYLKEQFRLFIQNYEINDIEKFKEKIIDKIIDEIEAEQNIEKRNKLILSYNTFFDFLKKENKTNIYLNILNNKQL